MISRAVVWACVSTLWLTACTAKPPVPEKNRQDQPVHLHNVGGECDPGEHEMEPELVAYASKRLRSSLPRTLERSGLLNAAAATDLDICFEQFYLRSGLVTLLLFPVAEPDYLAVSVTLSRAGVLQQRWKLSSENGAGGSMATASKARRVQMLINVINRKLVLNLKKATIHR
ncbi:MAG: hypothetical protein COW18_05800 [Zetaproteobacteria bacterium CG12_big_fil_rev_8_21_14_0_65_54_13]|nr:MAG: hypothetical protein COW18_05800 [Zetaproteobacteria bacterium CG12_big_fil_rev_8_21_14_0_65_54_13]PIX54790.1 MAG: hypothetical protein COZ50_06315 [Zetaproteobacteria bacterium CG_4_10_14_3_um_filter_54_28]PJA29654.1 MAG: hypothetical protein CO188_06005 [Zetaproteobacteria bacterium CG_4_9_14_3_um_filter_54_145]